VEEICGKFVGNLKRFEYFQPQRFLLDEERVCRGKAGFERDGERRNFRWLDHPDSLDAIPLTVCIPTGGHRPVYSVASEAKLWSFGSDLGAEGRE
jgi:hypothetical protein